MDIYAVNDWDELEASYFGKSTGTYDYAPQPVFAGSTAAVRGYAPQNIPEAVPSRNIPNPKTRKKAQEDHKRHMEIVAAHKSKERYISAKRLKEALVVSLGIAIIASMFAFLLYRQSQITTLNFQNNAVQKQIKVLDRETSQIQEELISNADLEQIRWDAMEKLAMQEPSAKQMVTVKLPSADLLVTNASSGTSISSKASLAIAKANLAQYYSSIE